MSGTTRTQRASRHADRSWTCPCGRTVWGNGGKSSHRRACLTYKRTSYVHLGQMLAAGVYDHLPHTKRIKGDEFEALRRELRGEQ